MNASACQPKIRARGMRAEPSNIVLKGSGTMKSLSRKSIVLIHAALVALMLLSACSFSLPQIGGKKAAGTGTPEAAETAGAGERAGAEDGAPASGEEAPTPEPGQPVFENAISAADFNDPENPPHGMVLFTSTADQPFEDSGLPYISNPDEERYLWAISSDGTRAGSVSPEGMGTALYIPEAAGKLHKFIANGFELAGEQFEPVMPPEDCGIETCGGFQFSSNGKMLAYFSGADACGRTLNLFDLGEQKAINTWESVHWAYFFMNGSLIFAKGDCESQQVRLYYPNSGKEAGVGAVGKAHWNPAHTAVIYQVQGEPEVQAALWGFNLETSRVFLWPSEETVIEDTPIWLADGENFVFQHQPYRYDKATKDALLTGPRQVILMNANTRAQRLLGFDTHTSFHLCEENDLLDGVGSPCEQTHGTWLRVLRLPYHTARFPAADRSAPEARCALYGLDCEDQPEVLALDWQTGKQVPWEEARVPEATATPSAHLPDLDTQPLYEDPDGAFAFYVGKSGKTLWYVPRDREPALWVNDGENFIYLP